MYNASLYTEGGATLIKIGEPQGPISDQKSSAGLTKNIVAHYISVKK